MDPEPDFKNIREFKEYNLDFISGKINKTFYHDAPLCPDSEQIADKIWKVNNFGFLTMNGQSDECTSKEEQRSYLEGYISYDIGLKLIKYVKYRGLKFYTLDKNNNVLHNIDFKKHCFNLTRVLPDGKYFKDSGDGWCLATNLYSDMVFGENLTIDSNLLNLFKQNNYIYLIIMAPNYCEGIVEDVILDFLVV